jgi:Chlorite dismutase
MQGKAKRVVYCLCITIVLFLDLFSDYHFISVASANPYEDVTMDSRLFHFIGGDEGVWHIVKTSTIIGEPLLTVNRLNIVSDEKNQPDRPTGWVLRGITSNERYVIRDEKRQLLAKQQGLGRPEATRAAMILIRKNAAWWALTQDERRNILEEQSKHIQIGLRYLPAIARRLHHCRDLSESEPFDFITWFEFSPAHEVQFNQLVAELRASEEWKYVDREIDIRLERN